MGKVPKRAYGPTSIIHLWKNPGEDALDTLFALPGPPSLWVGVNVAKVVFDSLVIAWAVF